MESVKTRMGISIRDLLFHLQFQAIQSERPGTGQKERMERTISVRKFRLGILVHLSRNPVFPGNFPFGKTKLVFPFTFQPKFPDFFVNDKKPNNTYPKVDFSTGRVFEQRDKPGNTELYVSHKNYFIFMRMNIQATYI